MNNLSLRRYLIVVVSILVLISLLSAAEVFIPEDGFEDGWVKSGNPKKFSRNDLYGHINGGAELYLEFGFEELVVQRYTNDESELDLELYQMDTPEAALGLFLMTIHKESREGELKERYTLNQYQLITVKGNVFIKINNFNRAGFPRVAMLKLAESVFSNIKKSKKIKLFINLPSDNLVEGSERIFRGPFALQPVFTFGDGDILRQGGKIFGVMGEYKTGNDSESIKILVVPYQDEAYAAETFVYLYDNLDRYLQKLGHSDNKFSFKDYNDRFGLVELNNSKIRLTINLSKNPVKTE